MNIRRSSQKTEIKILPPVRCNISAYVGQGQRIINKPYIKIAYLIMTLG